MTRTLGKSLEDPRSRKNINNFNFLLFKYVNLNFDIFNLIEQ